MILRKVSLTKVVVSLFILLLFDLSFSQIRSETTVCFSGVIKSISGDYKFVVVNDVNILISSSARIVLKAGDLKSEFYVVLQGVESLDGILVKKIVVTKFPAV